jgi:Fe-S-cluster containining protein
MDTDQSERGPSRSDMMWVAELEQPVSLQGDRSVNPLQRDLQRGLRFAHVMMSINQLEGREGAVFARALAELLVGKGMLAKEELQTMTAQVREQMEAQPAPKVMLARTDDKYSVEHTVIIDCASRIHICRAKCCTLNFYLTDQDLDEGIVKWDYGRPYWIQKREDGHCVHCDKATWRCRVHPYRPYVCRAYDCRHDERIWVDFERMIPNPELQQDAEVDHAPARERPRR